jgi:hypothetical protein
MWDEIRIPFQANISMIESLCDKVCQWLVTSRWFSPPLKLVTIKELLKKKWNRKWYNFISSWGELRCSGRVGSPYYTSDTRRVNLVTNPVLSHESWINVKEMQVKRPNAHQWGTTGETFVAIHCYLYTAIPQSNSRDCLPFRSTWVLPRFLVGFVLLDL